MLVFVIPQNIDALTPPYPDTELTDIEVMCLSKTSNLLAIGKLLSPKMQIFCGTALENIKCNEGLELIFKSTDGFPACVKPKTAEKLIERGWATVLLDNKELETTIPTIENIPIHKVNKTGVGMYPAYFMKLENSINLQNNEIVYIEGKFTRNNRNDTYVNWADPLPPNSVCLDKNIDVIKDSIISATVQVIENREGKCSKVELVEFEILYDKNELDDLANQFSHLCQKIENFVNKDRTSDFIKFNRCLGKDDSPFYGYYWIAFESKLVAPISGYGTETWEEYGGYCNKRFDGAVVFDLAKKEISEIYVNEPQRSCWVH